MIYRSVSLRWSANCVRERIVCFTWGAQGLVGGCPGDECMPEGDGSCRRREREKGREILLQAQPVFLIASCPLYSWLPCMVNRVGDRWETVEFLVLMNGYSVVVVVGSLGNSFEKLKSCRQRSNTTWKVGDGSRKVGGASRWKRSWGRRRMKREEVLCTPRIQGFLLFTYPEEWFRIVDARFDPSMSDRMEKECIGVKKSDWNPMWHVVVLSVKLHLGQT